MDGVTPSLATFILVPWACLAMILLCGLAGGSVLGWLTFGVLFSASFWYAMKHKGSTSQGLLSMLALIACVIGISMCVHASRHFLRDYWIVDGGASYFNVLPGDAAGGRSDAVTIDFSNGTRVDTSRTYGYLDSVSGKGKVYCVAPVADDKMVLEGAPVQFWAVGTDCCHQRSNFNCEDSSDAQAKGGVVVRSDSREGIGFQNAIRGAEFAYGLQSAPEHMLVRWVVDPAAWHQQLWHRTVELFISFTSVYLVFSCMIGVTLSQTLKQ
jgi:hypothetical protein